MKNSWENHGTPWCSPWKIRFTFSQLSIDTPIKSHEIPLNPNEFYHFHPFSMVNPWLFHHFWWDRCLVDPRPGNPPGPPRCKSTWTTCRGATKTPQGSVANSTSVSSPKKTYIILIYIYIYVCIYIYTYVYIITYIHMYIYIICVCVVCVSLCPIDDDLVCVTDKHNMIHYANSTVTKKRQE